MPVASFLHGALLIVGVYCTVLAASSPISYTFSVTTRQNCERVPLYVRLICFKRAFRTIDGSCNNLCNITRGITGGPFVRFIPPAYQDGIQAPRKLATNFHPLPNARSISKAVFTNTNENLNNMAPNFTHMTMAWGTFIDHDFALTESNRSVECGTNNERCPPTDGCIGINIFSGQELRNNASVQCIPLRRSAIRNGEQVNLVSSPIDASQVYGSTCQEAEAVRDRVANLGLLLLRPLPATSAMSPILPAAGPETFCRSRATPTPNPCFLAGDVRPNENQGLMAIHTIFVREHNRIALHLHQLNPHWGDQRLFEEARKIVIAVIQHITYNEWLPVFFSEQVRRDGGILLEPNDQFFEGYDPQVSHEVINSFAAAALRMGHSLIRDQFSQQSRNFVQRATIPVKRFHDPDSLYSTANNGIGGILLGLITDLSQKLDPFFTDAIRENLVMAGPDINGIVGDLLAINIQRGRDQGLPPYVDFRAACGLGNAVSFQDLSSDISAIQIERLSSVYTSARDIDLFAGGMSETPAPGSNLGPTFTCIIARQFKNFRFGDRFWYERDDLFVGFTTAQLREIRKSSLARIICDNSNGVIRLQREVFRSSTDRVNCYQIDSVNLNEWKEDPASDWKEPGLIDFCAKKVESHTEPTSEEIPSMHIHA